MQVLDYAMFVCGVYAYLYMNKKYKKIIAGCLAVYALTRLFSYFI